MELYLYSPPTCLHGVEGDKFTCAFADSTISSAEATNVARTVTNEPLNKQGKRRLVCRHTTNRPRHFVRNCVCAGTITNSAAMQNFEVTSDKLQHIRNLYATNTLITKLKQSNNNKNNNRHVRTELVATERQA